MGNIQDSRADVHLSVSGQVSNTLHMSLLSTLLRPEQQAKTMGLVAGQSPDSTPRLFPALLTQSRNRAIMQSRSRPGRPQPDRAAHRNRVLVRQRGGCTRTSVADRASNTGPSRAAALPACCRLLRLTERRPAFDLSTTTRPRHGRRAQHGDAAHGLNPHPRARDRMAAAPPSNLLPRHSHHRPCVVSLASRTLSLSSSSRLLRLRTSQATLWGALRNYGERRDPSLNAHLCDLCVELECRARTSPACRRGQREGWWEGCVERRTGHLWLRRVIWVAHYV